eukprot:3469439-Pyramimonas_sp.AAC.1
MDRARGSQRANRTRRGSIFPQRRPIARGEGAYSRSVGQSHEEREHIPTASANHTRRGSIFPQRRRSEARGCTTLRSPAALALPVKQCVEYVEYVDYVPHGRPMERRQLRIFHGRSERMRAVKSKWHTRWCWWAARLARRVHWRKAAFRPCGVAKNEEPTQCSSSVSWVTVRGSVGSGFLSSQLGTFGNFWWSTGKGAGSACASLGLMK